ncbi:hypothetical protein Zmor_015319 [Zophobas morio]|uniref:Uncharacterized protein n=1 Tax=Zophobas morio TaxID=2755281 RepID=A0AA38MH38_9CUCU|nr:hypothetical protein Zmor_015319 [Zophobas morio]
MEIHALALDFLSAYAILMTVVCIILAIQRNCRNLCRFSTNQEDKCTTLDKESLRNVLSDRLTTVYEQTAKEKSLNNPRDFFLEHLSRVVDNSVLEGKSANTRKKKHRWI